MTDLMQVSLAVYLFLMFWLYTACHSLGGPTLQDSSMRVLPKVRWEFYQ